MFLFVNTKPLRGIGQIYLQHNLYKLTQQKEENPLSSSQPSVAQFQYQD